MSNNNNHSHFFTFLAGYFRSLVTWALHIPRALLGILLDHTSSQKIQWHLAGQPDIGYLILFKLKEGSQVTHNNFGFWWDLVDNSLKFICNFMILLTGWDRAVYEASEVYKTRMHNLVCDNCHSHVAHALNLMNYKSSSSWNMVWLAFLMLIHGRFVNFAGFLKTWIPFLIILAAIVSLSVLRPI